MVIKRKLDSGFTLIELLVVVAILGILSSIAVFSVVALTHSASVNACQTDWRSVSNAATAYINDNPKTALTKFELYKKNKDGTSNDLTGTLSALGYMTAFVQPNGYKVKLSWTTTVSSINTISSQLPVIDIYDANGITKLGSTSSDADCSFVP